MPPQSFNLKQRLAALSLAQSSPSSPSNAKRTQTQPQDFDSPMASNSRRKLFHTWLKKPHEGTSDSGGNTEDMYTDEEKRMVQEVMSRIIFQAGVDYETRPMVVFNASALPDPQSVPYDLLLLRILSYLNLYVEADYTVVFFAAGSKHTPSWNWVWKAYRSLSRKYRKNLKQLYIVHSSFFSKMLFSLAGAIISPKFFRKIVYIPTLSELATRVPLTQIDVPPAIYQENSKYECKITLPIPVRANLFGVPLEDIMGYTGEKGGIPRVVRDAIQYLRETGLNEEGLFRRSPSSALLRTTQEAYDRGNVVSLSSFADPHLAAVLLKKYLRDLPQPIFPESMYGIIRQCPLPPTEHGDDLESIYYIKNVMLPELTACARILLSHVIHLLHDVSLRSNYNRMTATNLAIVICPNLVKGANPMRDVMMCAVPVPGSSSQTERRPTQNLADDGGEKATLGIVIAICIRRYYEIFDETIDRAEAVAPWRTLGEQGDGSGETRDMYVLGDGDDDDDLDEDVPDQDGRPIAIGSHRYVNNRHRNTVANASSKIASNPSFNMNGNAPSHGHTRSVEKAKMNNGKGAVGTVGKSTISLGRGTSSKGSGAAVEALSITAEGFFSDPGAPALPQRPKATLKNADPNPQQSDTGEEEPSMSVSERRLLFERQAQ